MSLVTSEKVASAPTIAVRVESGCASSRPSVPKRFPTPNSDVLCRRSVKCVRSQDPRATHASVGDTVVRTCAARYPLRESVRAPRSVVSTLNGWNTCPRSSHLPRLHQLSGTSYRSTAQAPETSILVLTEHCQRGFPAKCRGSSWSCCRQPSECRSPTQNRPPHSSFP